MRNESHKSKLKALLHYVDQWRARVGSREAVALAIVETHQRHGLESSSKIRFETAGDTFTLAKNAADRIFRWLDDQTKDNNYMPANFEQSILLAMPEDLRYAYVNEMLRPLGFSARKFIFCFGQEFDVVDRVKAINKEGSEAMAAVLNLSQDSSLDAMEAAHKELSESIGTQRAARSALEEQIAQRKHVGA
ncbi:hypothetical protein HC956_08150 [Alcaligenes faecalis]|uniref:Bacterial toxin YdaT domain-containing protein n=1 Tax=Alcaligenes ammonioxydans TaxID=2582914 RepID=A0ABX8STG4_9BURK|nr:hypothetical protein [Alcaligenes ammonioxydans]QXX78989.1 hypothetical protein FE795_08150 [Alcaligenes ammonioxydans]